MSVDKATLDELRIHRTSGGSRNRKPAAIVAILVIMVAVALALFIARPKRKVVRVAAAQGLAGQARGAVLNASGYVTARRQATVSSKVTGKVSEIFVEEGLHVKAGQLLARLDDAYATKSLRLAEAQSAQAASALEETRVRIAQAKLDYERARQLTSNQIASKADLDRAKAELDAQRAHLAALNDSLAVAQRNAAINKQGVDDTEIRAPFDGVVVSKDAQPGEMISPVSAGGGFTRTGICTLVDMESLEIEVDVAEAYINRVRPNQPVEATLDAYPDWKIPAHVITPVPTAERQKATVKVRIAFDQKDPRILPEMGVKVAFIDNQPSGGAAESVVEVPKSALRRVENQDIVFVLSGNHVERRAVKVASAENDRARIAAGIHEGEQVVIEGPADLADGDTVRVAEEKKG
jgi:RND family efflux transporter MFP subunit